MDFIAENIPNDFGVQGATYSSYVRLLCLFDFKKVELLKALS
jgi:hypothetical protein